MCGRGMATRATRFERTEQTLNKSASGDELWMFGNIFCSPANEISACDLSFWRQRRWRWRLRDRSTFWCFRTSVARCWLYYLVRRNEEKTEQLTVPNTVATALAFNSISNEPECKQHDSAMRRQLLPFIQGFAVQTLWLSIRHTPIGPMCSWCTASQSRLTNQTEMCRSSKTRNK